jgi:hypothetical protein
LHHQRAYKTDTKVKVVLPRPLKIERIYEEKVVYDQTEKPLAKEVELVDFKPKINVYKSRYDFLHEGIQMTLKVKKKLVFALIRLKK